MDFLIFIQDDDMASYLDDVCTVVFIAGLPQICLISHLSFIQKTLDKFMKLDKES